MTSGESNSEKSVSYQKKDGRSHARPSFFWYVNDKDHEVCFLVTHVSVTFHCRFIVIYYPLRRGDICTPRRAKLVVISLAVFSMVAYTFAIWTSGQEEYQGICLHAGIQQGGLMGQLFFHWD